MAIHLKGIRIIIASPKLSDLIYIEKMIISNGCHRVVQLTSLHDVFKLINVPGHPVDLLIIDEKMGAQYDHHLHASTLCNPFVNFVLFYKSNSEIFSTDRLFNSHHPYYAPEKRSIGSLLNEIFQTIQTTLGHRRLNARPHALYKPYRRA